MPVLLSVLFLALSVKQDRTPLRAGCAEDAELVTTLSAGSSLTIRYALTGETTPCYKVAVESHEGYLPASAIDGLEDFDKARREAAWLDTTQLIGAIRASSTSLPALKGPNGVAQQAAQLIEASQPARALELLDPEVRKRKDPILLALAGVAAWRNDDSRSALDYWRTSLDLQPNPAIENLYRNVERESKGDQSADKVYGLRVVLRYESASVPVETARQMVTVLDDEYRRISMQLGCHAEERIIAIAQSRDAYRKTTDSAEWNGGQFDGRIRVPVFNGLDSSMRRVLAHETTHACLSMLGRWPSWLQEGLAQKLSGDTLKPVVREKLAEMARQGKLPRLGDVSQDWSRLDTEHAVMAYALSLAAVELFYENYGQDGIANLVRNPGRLAEITSDLDKRLGL